jgi:hypothetical protein
MDLDPMPNLSKNVFFSPIFSGFFLIIGTLPYLQLDTVKNYANVKDDLSFGCCKMQHSKP